MCEDMTCFLWHRVDTRVQTHRQGNPGGMSACTGSGQLAERGLSCKGCTSSSGRSWHWEGEGERERERGGEGRGREGGERGGHATPSLSGRMGAHLVCSSLTLALIRAVSSRYCLICCSSWSGHETMRQLTERCDWLPWQSAHSLVEDV